MNTNDPRDRSRGNNQHHTGGECDDGMNNEQYAQVHSDPITLDRIPHLSLAIAPPTSLARARIVDHLVVIHEKWQNSGQHQESRKFKLPHYLNVKIMDEKLIPDYHRDLNWDGERHLIANLGLFHSSHKSYSISKKHEIDLRA